MSRLVGMSFTLRFSDAIPEEGVELAERVDSWPEKITEAFPVTNPENGVVSGMTQVERVEVSEDRCAVTFHLALDDALDDPGDRLVVPPDWTP